jgi:hypothetical protein
MADIVDQIIKRKLLIVGIGLSCAAALVLSAAFLVNGPSELSRADRLAAPSAAAALFSASLRSVDRDDKMPIDINAHLDKTLSLVTGELSKKATVHKKYGPIGECTCYLRELNQVFMGIIPHIARDIHG